MGTEIDLDAILAIVDGYDARMKIVREYFDRREPVPEEYKQYLAPLEDEDVVKAFEALRPLVARVRELERQRKLLAEGYADSISCLHCPLRYDCPSDLQIDTDPTLCALELMEWAEQAAKEEHHDG